MGYLCAAVVIHTIHSRLGWRGIAILSPVLRLTSVVILSTGPAYPMALTGYFGLGLGTGLSDSGFCAWAGNAPRTNVVQGLMHGSFSVGAVLGPLVATEVSKNGFEWYMFYRMMVSCLPVLIQCMIDRDFSGITRGP